MLEKIKTNPSMKYFMLYSYTFIFYGCIISAPGPVIPFLSSQYEVPQTQFTFLFMCRGGGFILGSILVKLLSGKINYHAFIGLGTILSGIPFILFPFTHIMNVQGFYIFLSSIFCGVFQILLNMCLLQSHRGNNEDFWLQVLHSVFGLGGLIGPLFIKYFGIYGCIFIGIGMLIGFPGYALLKSPQGMSDEGKENQEVKDVKFISRKSELILMFMFFLYFGQQTGFVGWISSYAVIQGADTKEGAAIYPAIFWISITIFRFVFAVVNLKVTQKLKLLILIQIGVFVTTILFAYLGYDLLAIYWSSILSGLAYSSMYALIYTTSLQYNQSIAQSQAASIMMCGSLGQGVLVSTYGYFMKFFGPKSLFIVLLLSGLSLYKALKEVMIILERDQKNNELKTQSVQLKEKLTK